jgi:hypothetical protein
MCTKHLTSFPFLYSDSTEISGFLDILLPLPQIDLYANIGFTPIARLLVRPQTEFGTFVSSMDTSNVPIKS